MKRDYHTLKWMEPLIIGERVKKPDSMRQKLDQGKLRLKGYVITLSDTPGNMLEFFSVVQLKQKVLRDLCPEIVALAADEEEAYEIVQSLVEEAMSAYGTPDVVKYLKNR